MRIDFYDFGRIKIEGEVYERDVIIFPDRVVCLWTRKESHYFDNVPDIVNQVEIETVIIGTGYDGVMRVAPNVEEFFKAKGIKVIVQKTIDAWKTYNELSKTKKIIALFHLTC